MNEELVAGNEDAVAAAQEAAGALDLDPAVLEVGGRVAVTPQWLLDVLTDRNERISALTAAVTASTSEVSALRDDLDMRPTREEVAGSRRRSTVRVVAGLLVLILVAAYVAIFAHEQYRNACYVAPSRTGAPAPDWCDNVFPGVAPGHDH